jgi:hypothetical protein
MKTTKPKIFLVSTENIFGLLEFLILKGIRKRGKILKGRMLFCLSRAMPF